ncbi:CFS_G0023680.mRNA.1.CDS.1 [Saccharomyces cerevisiae]|nr:CFS_G0023680.mRNA.1.CDS.1 [Saccharomyces cerevisiae]CAI7329345.1 CFS_G0023680.mRNA.1.CDS.1 [Saccharomyces cerevisiae]
MEGGEEEVERIPDELFDTKKKHLLDKLIRVGIILVLLIWGTVFVAKKVYLAIQTHQIIKNPTLITPMMGN